MAGHQAGHLAHGAELLMLQRQHRIVRQFVVNVNGSQSVSTMPVNGLMPLLGSVTGPITSKFKPGGLRNKYPTFIVTMPREKSEMTNRSIGRPAPCVGHD
jgi:hypothetical protein